MSSYANLMGTLQPAHGSETHARLLKLQELEQLRKQRNAGSSRFERQGSTRSRPRRFGSDNAETSSYTTTADIYGGARPKLFAQPDPVLEQTDGNIFSGIATQVIGKPTISRRGLRTDPKYGAPEDSSTQSGFGSEDVSGFTRSGPGDVESGDGKENIFSGFYQSNIRTGTSGYGHSYSKPEDSSRMFSETGDNESQGSRNYYTVDGISQDSGPTSFSQHTRPVYEDHGEGGSEGVGEEQQGGEVVEEWEEEYEEPIHFIQRLKGESSHSDSSDSNSSHKRTAQNGYLISNIPTVPPLKRAKSGDNDEEENKENAMDDILSVAQDISDAFGHKSPLRSDSESFNFSAGADCSHGAGDNDGADVVFTATSPTAKVKRTSSKRKKRPSFRGSKDVKSSASSATSTDANEESALKTEVGQDDQSHSAADEQQNQQDNAGKTVTVFHNGRPSEWFVTDHPPGRLDQMQEYFTGTKVDGEDPVIRRYLNGKGVKDDFEDSMVMFVPNQDSLLRTPPSSDEVDFESSPSPRYSSAKSEKVSKWRNTFESKVESGSDNNLRKSSDATTSASDVENSSSAKKKQSSMSSETNRRKSSTLNSSDTESPQPESGSDSSRKTFTSLRSSRSSRLERFSPRVTDSVKSSPDSSARTRISSPRAGVNSSTPVSSQQEAENARNMSLEDKLAKLQTLTQEKSRRQSEQDQADAADAITDSRTPERRSRYSRFSDRKSYSVDNGVASGTVRSTPEMSLRNLQSARKNSEKSDEMSSRDLAGDVRALKNYVHENVSEPGEASREYSRRLSRKKALSDASTMTNSNPLLQVLPDKIVYMCPHCGKASDETVAQQLAAAQRKPAAADLKAEKKEKAKLADLKKETKERTKSVTQNGVKEKPKLAETRSVNLKNGVKDKTVQNEPSKEAPSKPSSEYGDGEKKETKTKTASSSKGYLKNTASSSRKKISPADGNKLRKGSTPDLYSKAFTLELESRGQTAPSESGSGFVRVGGKVAQRAKAFESKQGEKTKPSTLKRGTSAERSRVPSTENTESTMAKSKSMEQMSLFAKQRGADKAALRIKDKTSSAGALDKRDKEKVRETDKQKDETITKKDDKKRTETASSSSDVQKVEDENVESSTPIGKRTRAQLMKREKSPKPEQDVEHDSGPLLTSSRRASQSDGRDTPVFFNPQRDEDTPVVSTGQFTTITDNPFIKNDPSRRNSFRGRNDSDSVWVSAGLNRSNSSVGERSSGRLSWSSSGSLGSNSSLHGSTSSLHRTRSERAGSTSGTVLNLLGSAGSGSPSRSRHPVSGAIETDVDAAYQEFVDSTNMSKEGEGETDVLNTSAHLEFAEKALKLLDGETDFQSSDQSKDGKQKNKKKTNSDSVENGFVENGHIEASDDTSNAGKKNNKSKKGFFQEEPVTTVAVAPVAAAVTQVSHKAPVAAAVTQVSHKAPVAAAVTQVSHKAPAPSPPAPSPPAPSAGSPGNQGEDEGEELVQARFHLGNWDPGVLLDDLYKVKMMPDQAVDISHQFVGMEGLMEKLPMNKKKATLLKTWKRRFFSAKDGWLHYYETSNRDKPSDSLQLMGGKVEELGPRVLGVDDGRGKYLMVRVPTDLEFGKWKVALESQTADNIKSTYVRPEASSPVHPKKKVVVIDIGSSGIRAGILGEKPSLPQIFFPTVVAKNKQTGEVIVGADAYRPLVRKASKISYPVQPTNKVDKFNIDMEVMPEIFQKVFTDLQINPKEYLVMLSTPQTLGDRLKEGLMKIFMDRFQMKGACMVQQALLSMYSYNAMSGIIVDIGERMEILPIYEGLLIEGGVAHQAYGGGKVQDSLYISLLENKYKFNTLVEKLLVRFICEQSCYVADNYKELKMKCEKDPESHQTTVYLSNYHLPEGAYMSVNLDYSCFKSPEGFFNTDMWGMDYPNIHKLIYSAIQACPMDSRKHMYRSVYLSGGVTMLPGFAQRLQDELKKLAPPSVVVEVHASPQRYHSAFIGACAVAGMDVFEQSCVSAQEWKQLGVKACKKWGTS